MTNDSGLACGLTDRVTGDRWETALIDGAVFLQIAIGADVPLRDYADSVGAVAEALGLDPSQLAALFSGGTAD